MSRQEIIVLALPRSEAKSFPGEGLVCLGPDRDAIREGARDEILYDFGLGRRSAGFGIRTACPDLIARLDGANGLDWRQFLPSIGTDIQRASPTRVVRNAIGRIEVFTTIPPPNGKSPAGPHTHLLPAYLIEGSDVPSKIDMPEGYVACAIRRIRYARSEGSQGTAPIANGLIGTTDQAATPVRKRPIGEQRKRSHRR
jgi:hypothetical protein